MTLPSEAQGWSRPAILGSPRSVSHAVRPEGPVPEGDSPALLPASEDLVGPVDAHLPASLEMLGMLQVEQGQPFAPHAGWTSLP